MNLIKKYNQIITQLYIFSNLKSVPKSKTQTIKYNKYYHLFYFAIQILFKTKAFIYFEKLY